MTDHVTATDRMVERRRAYARAMTARAGFEDPALEDALAALAREDFLPPPPWLVFGDEGQERTSEPARLYRDVLVALERDRGVNNGSPSLHAGWIHALRPRPGERVVHIGAGSGYYTAVLARLVGPGGRVTAVEIDRELATLAGDALPRALPDGPAVEVVAGDGETWPREAADIVYVSFGIAAPAAPWLDRLAVGGRLLFPLCIPRGHVSAAHAWHGAEGVGLLVERTEAGFAAQTLDRCSFVYAEGAVKVAHRDCEMLEQAFRRGGWGRVRSLVRPPDLDSARCWYAGRDWGLCYDPPGR